MHRDIVEQQEKLHRLFNNARELHKQDDVDDLTKSAFVSFLCVRTSGYLETSVMKILREYVEGETREDKPNIANFAGTKLDFTFNPWPSEILRLLGQFNVEWKNRVRDEIKDRISSSVEAMVRNRNKIAHGEDVDLSLEDLADAFDDTTTLVDLVNTQCNARIMKSGHQDRG